MELVDLPAELLGIIVFGLPIIEIHILLSSRAIYQKCVAVFPIEVRDCFITYHGEYVHDLKKNCPRLPMDKIHFIITHEKYYPNPLKSIIKIINAHADFRQMDFTSIFVDYTYGEPKVLFPLTKYILENNLCINNMKSALIQSTINRYEEIVKLLLPLSSKETISRVFKYSIISNDVYIISLYLKVIDINTNNGILLRKSIINHNVRIVKFLLEKGADITIGNETPMELTLARDNVEIYKLLIKYGAPEVDIDTVFYYSATKLAKYFITRKRYSLETLVPFATLSIRDYDESLLLAILQQNANVANYCYEMAIICINKSAMKILLQCSHPSEEDIYLAIREGCVEILRLLLKHTKFKEKYTEYALQFGNEEIVEFITNFVE